ncbi:MAG: hypothetical protein EWV50_14820 [Microcystis aeruginosa Ma_MB_F_20061100_S20]|uniref:Uncharacterized protein n=1 Tax=Microcystis aeruginosa Ma_MB_F_20061100_S20D TaxID=2486253 RepID=A0A552F1V1_MICAE|nr:MAG: hypothetical protein EWV50_14820 [Microcystis aeruginosa Ma_MB_F_20061100_S20]TRU40693.1 MAG: hypothetical protein EWV78_00560 [Microcystis aeruginosa Ma_MB_F_20061100_S20D]
MIVHPKLPQKSPFKMFFKSLKGLLCLKLRIAGLLAFLLSSVLFLSLLISFRIGLEGFVASLKTAENTSELVEHFKRLP